MDRGIFEFQAAYGHLYTGIADMKLEACRDTLDRLGKSTNVFGVVEENSSMPHGVAKITNIGQIERICRSGVKLGESRTVLV